MKREEFIKLIGKDVYVDYWFDGEIQRWNMKNFIYDKKSDKISHSYYTNLIIDTFIPNCSIHQPSHTSKLIKSPQPYI